MDSATIQLIIEYRYLILIPLSFLEGPIVSFITGMLSSSGYFNPFAAFWIFIVKDLIVDGFFYYLGRYAGTKRFTHRLLDRAHVTEGEMDDLRKLWSRHGLRTMFMGKLSWGISPAFLAAAGIVSMPFARYFSLALLVALLQYGILFVLGYFFGGTLGGSIAKYIDSVGYVIAVVATVATVYYMATFYFRRKLREEEKEVEIEG